MNEINELLFELIRMVADEESAGLRSYANTTYAYPPAGERNQTTDKNITEEDDAQSVPSERNDLISALTPEVLRKLFAVAKSHDMAHLLAEALDRLGLLDEGTPEGKAFFTARQMAVYRYEQNFYECQNLYDAFEKAKIFYIPLKGAIIRGLYPEAWMRTSCDVDILVAEEDISTALRACAGLDYETKGKGYHDYSLVSPARVHLELHFSICENKKNLDKVLKRVWDNVQPARDTGYEYALTPEFLIFHNVAHATYHFLEGGCGIRPLLDLWLLRKKTEFDEAEVKAFCEEAGIAKFYDALVQLSEVWFSKAEHNDLTREMENYILSGGVYGTTENRMNVKTRKGGKVGYFFTLAFLPYENMKVLYPVLGKHKILLPACWVRRWCRILFGGMSSAGRKAMKAKVSKEEVRRTAQLFGNLELLG